MATVTRYPRRGYESPIYVLVHHEESKRSFRLDRTYTLVDTFDFLCGVPNGMEVVNTWDGWKPTMDSQCPEWARPLPEKEFKATWVEEKKEPSR